MYLKKAGGTGVCREPEKHNSKSREQAKTDGHCITMPGCSLRTPSPSRKASPFLPQAPCIQITAYHLLGVDRSVTRIAKARDAGAPRLEDANELGPAAVTGVEDLQNTAKQVVSKANASQYDGVISAKWIEAACDIIGWQLALALRTTYNGCLSSNRLTAWGLDWPCRTCRGCRGR